MTVTYRRLIDENRILNLNSRDLDEAEAQSIAAGIALKRIPIRLDDDCLMRNTCANDANGKSECVATFKPLMTHDTVWLRSN